jgi:hypothetical protein
VVRAWHWESAGTVLVDQRTGRRTSLLGAPSVSPDGRHLLSMCEDVTSGGTPTDLSRYRCRPLARCPPRGAAASPPQRRLPGRRSHGRHPRAPTYAELELPAQPQHPKNSLPLPPFFSR